MRIILMRRPLLFELQSKLLRGGYAGEYDRGFFKGATRSIVNGSFNVEGVQKTMAWSDSL